MALSVRGRSPTTVFGLLGSDENSATTAVGWTLEHCPAFRQGFLEACGVAQPKEPPSIVLQRHAEDGGFTDIEIWGPELHLVIEAKKSWEFPSDQQLGRYVGRFKDRQRDHCRMVSVSSADMRASKWALQEKVGDVDLLHLSWGSIVRIASDAQSKTGGFEERVWLRHLITHIREYAAMSSVNDNNVWVVSLSDGEIQPGNAYRWLDVVEKDSAYYHPVGNKWPVQPPNYIAFRYHGRLQSVHHIDSSQIVEQPIDVNPRWSEADMPHFVHRLGLAMRPPREMRTGSQIRQAAHAWCALDTLISGQFDTIGQARDETNRRHEAAEADI